MDHLKEKLKAREQQGNLRSLKITSKDLIDFSSNDYLGFAKITFDESKSLSHGSGGSRLLSGNYPLIEATEKKIAAFHQAKSGLIFNSGYAANLGVFSSIPQKGDTILFDELIHASIKDGMRLSFASKFSFKHNDSNHLIKKLEKASGEIYVVVEAVYSMDGDVAPLNKLVELSKQFGFHLIVDEAHSLGVFGNNGAGLVNHLNLAHEIPIRIVTFGKALGCHGAIVLSNEVVKNYLINFSRPFIYSTALPPSVVCIINQAYDHLINSKALDILKNNISFFNTKVAVYKLNQFIKSDSAIHCMIMPGNDKVKALSSYLTNSKLDVKPVLSPTVKKGSERLRICLHSYNTESEIDELLKKIATF